MSLIEATANVAIGFGVAVLAQIVVFPLFGLDVPFTDNLLIGAAFTGVSVLRSYMMRRLFEAWRVRRERFALTRHSDHEMIGPARS